MKRKWKIWLILIGVLVLAGGTLAGVNYSKRGIVEVQTGRVTRQDLATIVTASGEIKPRNYINIGTNAMQPSRITDILVKEGDRVKKGQLLARLEAVQPQADVTAQKAAVRLPEADSSPPKPRSKRPTKASVPPRLPSTAPRPTWNRPDSTTSAARICSRTQLIAQQHFDTLRTAYDSAWPLSTRSKRAAASQAQRDQTAAHALRHSAENHAGPGHLNRFNDVLQKTLLLRAARRRGHQPAGARGRDRGSGHPELGREHRS